MFLVEFWLSLWDFSVKKAGLFEGGFFFPRKCSVRSLRALFLLWLFGPSHSHSIFCGVFFRAWRELARVPWRQEVCSLAIASHTRLLSPARHHGPVCCGGGVDRLHITTPLGYHAVIEYRVATQLLVLSRFETKSPPSGSVCRETINTGYWYSLPARFSAQGQIKNELHRVSLSENLSNIYFSFRQNFFLPRIKRVETDPIFWKNSSKIPPFPKIIFHFWFPKNLILRTNRWNDPSLLSRHGWTYLNGRSKGRGYRHWVKKLVLFHELIHVAAVSCAISSHVIKMPHASVRWGKAWRLAHILRTNITCRK